MFVGNAFGGRVLGRESVEEGRERMVQQTNASRYCWRAGVMSRNEGKKEEELLV